MKQIIVLLLLISGCSRAQQPPMIPPGGTIYLVRHAEKDTGKNPALTLAGQERAQELANRLGQLPITRIYMTAFKRSVQTGEPLRLRLGADSTIYTPDTTGTGLFERMKLYQDTQLLVVAHSNTVPHLIRKLGVLDFPLNDLPDHVYDKLFIIRNKNGQIVLEISHYGKPTP